MKNNNEITLNAVLQAANELKEFCMDDLQILIPDDEKLILSVLGSLKSISVLEKTGAGKSASYKIIKKPSPFQLAKLADMGADFIQIPKWFSLSKAEIQAGLNLSVEVGKFMQLEEERIKAISSTTKLDLTKEDEVSKTLEILLSAAKEALAKGIKKKESKAVVASLEGAVKEAESVWLEYKRGLMKKPSGVWQSFDLED